MLAGADGAGGLLGPRPQAPGGVGVLALGPVLLATCRSRGKAASGRGGTGLPKALPGLLFLWPYDPGSAGGGVLLGCRKQECKAVGWFC